MRKHILVLSIILILLGIISNQDIANAEPLSTDSKVESVLPKIKDVYISPYRNAKTRFYYDSLSKEDRDTYRKIRKGMFEHAEKIYVKELDLDKAFYLFEFVLHDYPGIFWCDSEVS
ncbi:MAG: hypothetical protein ACK5LL_12630 [Suipraeoptans sp.]